MHDAPGPSIRLLAAADAGALDGFLARRADTSLFLRSNLRAGGVVDRGEPYQATWAAACVRGEIVAVAAHCWNGNVLLQAPAHLDAVVRAATTSSGRAVAGCMGPWSEVRAARALPGMPRVPRLVSRSILMALDLAALRVPAPLRDGRHVCRPLAGRDVPLATAWRVAYGVEELQRADGPGARAAAADDVRLLHAAGGAWMLEDAGAPVAFTAFNATLPDVVQIGGVYTPPALRARGYARAAVAGSLLTARDRGVSRAVLFVGEDNLAAQHAYADLGFRAVGDYGMVLY